VLVPADGGAAHRFEPVGQLVVGHGRHVGAGGPHHHLARRPAGLEPGLAHRVGGDEHGGGDVVDAEQPVVGGLQPGQLGLDVDHDLVALGALDAPYRVEVVLGVVEQAFERAPPPGRVGLEQCELLVAGNAVDRRPRGGLQCSAGLVHTRSGAPRACSRRPRNGGNAVRSGIDGTDTDLPVPPPHQGRDARCVKDTGSAPPSHVMVGDPGDEFPEPVPSSRCEQSP
jgi:hypothetical protein